MEATSVLVGVGGVAVTAVAAALVHRDARRVGLARPTLWAGIVATTFLIGLVTYLLVDTVPIPGLLVIVIAGPALYLFERDDARHGDAPADPRELPDAGGGDGDTREES